MKEMTRRKETGRVNNRWQKHVSTTADDVPAHHQPLATSQCNHDRDHTRSEVKCLLDDRAKRQIVFHMLLQTRSAERHTNTQKVCTVLKCVNLWLKFDSDDVQISHAMFTLYSPVSRNDTHTHARTQTAVSFMCVFVW